MIRKDGIYIKEERRLFYVGMTREMDELFLMYTKRRIQIVRKMGSQKLFSEDPVKTLTF